MSRVPRADGESGTGDSDQKAFSCGPVLVSVSRPRARFVKKEIILRFRICDYSSSRGVLLQFTTQNTAQQDMHMHTAGAAQTEAHVMSRLLRTSSEPTSSTPSSCGCEACQYLNTRRRRYARPRGRDSATCLCSPSRISDTSISSRSPGPSAPGVRDACTVRAHGGKDHHTRAPTPRHRRGGILRHQSDGDDTQPPE